MIPLIGVGWDDAVPIGSFNDLLQKIYDGTVFDGPVRIGTFKGRITVPDDFDDPLPDEILDAFEGKPT